MNAIQDIFGPSTAASAAPNKKELGQEDFLKLMVAQLKNQDPSNPSDNSEFLGQIAQFSMVSGIDELGASFDGIAGSLYSSQAMQAVGLVGKQVLADTNIGTLFEGESIEGVVEVVQPADEMKIQVLNEAGSLVKTINIGSVSPGLHAFSWDGLNENGELAPPGDYSLKPQGLVDGSITSLPLQTYSNVESVSVDRANTSVLLHLANDKNIGLSQVTEYR